MSRTLKHVTSEPISERVPVLLSTVCRKENFKTYDITPSVIEEACKLMMSKHNSIYQCKLTAYKDTKNFENFSSRVNYNISVNILLILYHLLINLLASIFKDQGHFICSKFYLNHYSRNVHNWSIIQNKWTEVKITA